MSKAARKPQRQQIPMPAPPFSQASGNMVCHHDQAENERYRRTPRCECGGACARRGHPQKVYELYVYACIRSFMHAGMYTYIHTHTHTHTHMQIAIMHTCAHTHACIHTNVHTRTHTHTHACIRTHRAREVQGGNVSHHGEHGTSLMHAGLRYTSLEP